MALGLARRVDRNTPERAASHRATGSGAPPTEPATRWSPCPLGPNWIRCGGGSTTVGTWRSRLQVATTLDLRIGAQDRWTCQEVASWNSPSDWPAAYGVGTSWNAPHSNTAVKTPGGMRLRQDPRTRGRWSHASAPLRVPRVIDLRCFDCVGRVTNS